MGDAEPKGVTKAKKIWGIIYRPEYAHDDDGLGELMPRERLIFAAQWWFSLAMPTSRRISESRMQNRWMCEDNIYNAGKCRKQKLH